MIAVLPVGTFPLLSGVEFLTRLAGDQLDRFGNRFISVSGIIFQEVNMILGDRKIEYAESEALFRLKQPEHPPLFILCIL